MRTIVVAVALTLAATCTFGWETDPPDVDESPALSIGDFEVSQYVVDKHYNQFVANHPKRAPTRAESASWLRLFLAQQVIKADLSQRGYLERPEVRRVVAQMSRYILTQPRGPLYQALYDQEPIATGRLHAAHQASGGMFDALVVRFDDGATGERLIGPWAERGTLPLRLQTLVALGSGRGFDAHNGLIVWPYHPFEEIAGELASAAPGVLLGPLARDLGTYFLLVRAGMKRQTPDFDTARAALERSVRDLDQLMVRRLRRRRILQDSEFSIDAAAVDRLQARIRKSRADGARIPDGAIDTMADAQVATYVSDRDHRAITAAAFVRDFNEKLFRQVPADSGALATAVEDMVVGEYDYRSALQAGLDRHPKFVQDRLNFALTQALALYETETLAKQLAISFDDIRAYHERHRDRYLGSLAATGTLYVFGDRSEAEAAIARLESAAAPLVAGAERIVDPLVVHRSGPPLVPDVPNLLLIQLPDGRCFGPFAHLGRHAVWVKRSMAPAVPLPLAEAEENVRRDLLRVELDALELELLRQNVAALRMHLDLAKYGVEPSFLADRTGDRVPSSTSFSPPPATRGIQVAGTPDRVSQPKTQVSPTQP